MTRPRTSTTRELYGLLGSFPNTSEILRTWNHYFQEHNIDAFMDRYPTTIKNLPERLSEMFHFDRRMYIVGDALQEAVINLLDDCDVNAKEEGKVNVIFNRDGVLCGKFIAEEQTDPKSLLELTVEVS